MRKRRHSYDVSRLFGGVDEVMCGMLRKPTAFWGKERTSCQADCAQSCTGPDGRRRQRKRHLTRRGTTSA